MEQRSETTFLPMLALVIRLIVAPMEHPAEGAGLLLDGIDGLVRSSGER